MCSRFALKSPPKVISQLFKLEQVMEWKPRYNIAPSQKIQAVIHPLEDKKRSMKQMQWGFVASWTQGGRLLVNAQSENIDEKPVLRESFEKWRCLVPVDGFYEWRHEAKETKPYFIRMKSGQPFALAGLWAPQQVNGQAVESCVILTTAPNDTVKAVHDRMPVIVDASDYTLWLDSQDVRDFGKIKELFHPFPADKMEAYEVDFWVNDALHDDERCMAPWKNPETIQLPF